MLHVCSSLKVYYISTLKYGGEFGIDYVGIRNPAGGLSIRRVETESGGTWRRTGGEVKGKEANGVSSQAVFSLTRNSPSSVIADSVRDGTRAEVRFGFPAKRTSPFISAGVSVQSNTGFLGVRVGGERL